MYRSKLDRQKLNVITDQEVDTILKLIDDWGWEYGLKTTSEEVGNLKESLMRLKNIGPVEMGPDGD